ncbi:MAG: hypothetical protein ACYTXE_33885 [Nostoc sp.]
MSKELQELQKLLNQAHTLLDQVLDHPYYQKLLEEGFKPESTIFDIQKSIVSLELDIKKITQKSMLENLPDVIANAKIEASKTIAQSILFEAEKQGVTLADLLLGFAQVAFSRGLEGSAKFLEDVSEKCRS